MSKSHKSTNFLNNNMLLKINRISINLQEISSSSLMIVSMGYLLWKFQSSLYRCVIKHISYGLSFLWERRDFLSLMTWSIRIHLEFFKASSILLDLLYTLFKTRRTCFMSSSYLCQKYAQDFSEFVLWRCLNYPKPLSLGWGARPRYCSMVSKLVETEDVMREAWTYLPFDLCSACLNFLSGRPLGFGQPNVVVSSLVASAGLFREKGTAGWWPVCH